MLSSIFNDKMPICQDIGGILELLSVEPINACLSFPFPNDFVGCEILEDCERNQQVRDIFETIPYKMQNERLVYQAEKLAVGKVFPILMFSLRYAIDEQLAFLEEMQKLFCLNILTNHALRVRIKKNHALRMLEREAYHG